MTEAPSQVFVLLSDLHFGPSWVRGGLEPILDRPWLLRFIGKNQLMEWMSSGLAAHDATVAASLPDYLNKCLYELRESGYDRDDFDLYIVSGDVVTWPDEESLQFAREYLSDLVGETERLVVIPGNHDKLFQTDLSLFHQFLLRPMRLHTEPGPGRSFLISKKTGNREVLITLLDANVYCDKNVGKVQDLNTLSTSELISCRAHVARGEISRTLVDDLSQKLRLLTAGREADAAHLEDYASAIKLLVIHYAVDYAQFRPHPALHRLIPHKCDDVDKLIRALGKEFTFAVHGHLHTKKVYLCGDTPVVAVSTTTQSGKSEQGFYLLKFFADVAYAQHHVWNPETWTFVADGEELLCRLLPLAA